MAEPRVEDLRNVVEGDLSPNGDGHIAIRRGIEVGHIFQLGTKYSEAMEATVLDEDGKSCLVTMGCYGIGVTRVIAAAIEQNHDDHGIAWPAAMAPFQVAVLPLNAARSERVREAAESVYSTLSAAGIDTLIDDRGLRPGVMFADMELIGIPHRLVVGERGLDQGVFEYKDGGTQSRPWCRKQTSSPSCNSALPTDGISVSGRWETAGGHPAEAVGHETPAAEGFSTPEPRPPGPGCVAATAPDP